MPNLHFSLLLRRVHCPFTATSDVPVSRDPLGATWSKSEEEYRSSERKRKPYILNLSQAKCWNGSLLQGPDTTMQSVILKKKKKGFSSAPKVTDIKDICVSFTSDSDISEACPPPTPSLVCEQVCVWDAALILEASPINPIPKGSNLRAEDNLSEIWV